MRFMILIRATADSEAGVIPEPAMFEAMNRFNEDLGDALPADVRAAEERMLEQISVRAPRTDEKP